MAARSRLDESAWITCFPVHIQSRIRRFRESIATRGVESAGVLVISAVTTTTTIHTSSSPCRRRPKRMTTLPRVAAAAAPEPRGERIKHCGRGSTGRRRPFQLQQIQEGTGRPDGPEVGYARLQGAAPRVLLVVAVAGAATLRCTVSVSSNGGPGRASTSRL
jgi:hypothetical protein